MICFSRTGSPYKKAVLPCFVSTQPSCLEAPLFVFRALGPLIKKAGFPSLGSNQPSLVEVLLVFIGFLLVPFQGGLFVTWTKDVN